MASTAGGQFGGDHPRLHHGVEVGLVDFQDLVEGVGQDHHAAGPGDGAAAQVGAGPPHGQRQAVIVAQAHHLAQGLGGSGPHHQGGQHRLQDRGVIGISEPVGFADKDLLRAQELLEILNQALTDHLRLLRDDRLQ